MRYAARTDANKDQIVSVLRAAGAYVYDLKLPVDLLVGHNGITVLVEIKDGNKPLSARKLTKLQQDFFDNWTGGPTAIVDNPEAALRLLKTIEKGNHERT